MTIVVPNTASTLSAAGSVVSSCGVWAWIGLQTLGAAGSCTWYRTNACTSGCEIMSISLIAQQLALFGPFNSQCGLYAAVVTGVREGIRRQQPPGT
mgnify:CR=1 FL=1